MKRLILVFLVLFLTSCDVEKRLQKKLKKSVDFATKHKIPCSTVFKQKDGSYLRTVNYDN